MSLKASLANSLASQPSHPEWRSLPCWVAKIADASENEIEIGSPDAQSASCLLLAMLGVDMSPTDNDVVRIGGAVVRDRSLLMLS